jgi:hypothetical protein
MLSAFITPGKLKKLSKPIISNKSSTKKFELWPVGTTASAEALAKAGFYLTGKLIAYSIFNSNCHKSPGATSRDVIHPFPYIFTIIKKSF